MTPRVRAPLSPSLVPILEGGHMLYHGRSTRLRLAPGATLAVECTILLTTFDHESGPKPPAVSCFF